MPTGRPSWETIRHLGLTVRWATLYEGLRMSTRDRVLVTVGDVGVWAAACVEAVPEQDDEVYDLLGIPEGAGNDLESVERIRRVLAALAADEDADPVVELSKWRLAQLVELVDRVATWPPEPRETNDSRPCSMWWECRELLNAWVELDRPAFFYPEGREVSCYDGRDLEELIAEYRAWIAQESARLRAAEAAGE